MLTTRLLMDGLYALEDERVRQFLVIGAERALLFDTGFADSGVLETVLSLTDKPVDATVLPCHSECPIDGSYIARDLEDALALRDGKLASEPHPTMPCRVYHGAATDYLYDGEMGD